MYTYAITIPIFVITNPLEEIQLQMRNIEKTHENQKTELER